MTKGFVDKVSTEMAKEIDADMDKMVYKRTELYVVRVICYVDSECSDRRFDLPVFATPYYKSAVEYKQGLLSGRYPWPNASDRNNSSEGAEDDIKIILADYDKKLDGFKL